MVDHSAEPDQQPAPAEPQPPEIALEQPFSAKYVSIERRAIRDVVFEVDDTSFRSNMPSPTHWSVAWSDLMMTMFILFLAMYVYQTGHQDFLVRETPEIVGGTTTDALDGDRLGDPALPIAPISTGLPLITAGTIKKVVKVNAQDLESDLPSPPEPPIAGAQPAKQATSGSESIPTEPAEPATPANAPAAESGSVPQQDIYRLSKEALANANLDKFAAIDLVPDSTMRIILTGDLLFATGTAELSGEAEESLQQLTEIIKKTPYMINVVGHTDNVPMRSARFTSNWELSVARASAVARFLIDEMAMDPGQFVVSGYSSYRPLLPNTDEANRAKNRRVEIIISKKLPNPVPASPENLQ